MAAKHCAQDNLCKDFELELPHGPIVNVHEMEEAVILAPAIGSLLAEIVSLFWGRIAPTQKDMHCERIVSLLVGAVRPQRLRIRILQKSC